MKYPLALILSFISIFSYSADVEIAIGEYAPYIDKSKSDHGFMTKIVQMAFEKSGMSSKVEFSPWKRIEEVEIDKNKRVSFAFIKTPARESKWFYSDNIMSATTVFVARKGIGFKWNTIDDLKAYKIGISRGYSYGGSFDSMKSKLQVFEASSDETNIKKLVAGRIDIFPVDPFVGAQIVRDKLSPDAAGKLEIIEKPSLSDDSMHAVCAKSYGKCKMIIDKFNSGLSKMKADGSLDHIIQQATALQ